MSNSAPEGQSPLLLPNYSDAYSKIIKDENDLAGIVAYGFYKGQKREFVIENGLSVDDEKAKAYHRDLNAGRISSLRMMANARLQDYASSILEDFDEQTLEKAKELAVYTLVDNRVSEMTVLLKTTKSELEIIIKSETAWWKAALWGLLGSVLFAIILTVALFIQATNPLNPFIDHGGSVGDSTGNHG